MDGMNNGVFRDANTGDIKVEVPVEAATAKAEGNSVGNGNSFLSGNTININPPDTKNLTSRFLSGPTSLFAADSKQTDSSGFDLGG